MDMDSKTRKSIKRKLGFVQNQTQTPKTHLTRFWFFFLKSQKFSYIYAFVYEEEDTDKLLSLNSKNNDGNGTTNKLIVSHFIPPLFDSSFTNGKHLIIIYKHILYFCSQCKHLIICKHFTKGRHLIIFYLDFLQPDVSSI
jgi:hypothetical protein